ncbi:MAG: hypothetical protein J6D27_03850 [Ruminiclostridium sp.]|nr:hypothetical protein [Ruminiclostridium sp.]
MELLSKGTYLAYSEAEEGTYKKLYGLRSTPDMGGDPEKVEVTNLNDSMRRYVRGIKDPGDLEFGFYYNSAEENPNATENEVSTSYATLRALDTAGTSVWYILVYPDGTGFKWKGSVSVKRSAAEVNGVLAFTLRTMCETELTDYTAAQTTQTTGTEEQTTGTEEQTTGA